VPRPRTRASGASPRQRNHFALIVLVLLAVGALTAAGSRLEDGQGSGGSGTPKARPGGARSPTTLTIAWSKRAGSLDPAFARDRTAENLLLNVMDPLVRLDENLTPVPNLAEGWETSADGKTVTFLLRRGGRWTNGDPVTARDFVFAWKRVLSPEVASPYASALFAIRGAAAYHTCVPQNCAELAAAVGVTAVGDYRLVVRLTSREPWFVAQSGQQAFLAVHRASVEQFGNAWARPESMVTNGPFRLEASGGDSIVLVRDPDWRNADRVEVERVDGRVIEDDMGRVQAFDAGDVLALDGAGLPASEVPSLRERREYEAYPALATYYYGFNLATIRDVHQRRAMSLAVDRRALIDNVAQGDEVPATGFAPPVGVGLPEEEAGSPWSPPDGDLDEARAELARATSVKRRVTLLHIDAPGNRQLATALQDAWRELGIQTTIRSRPAKGYLDFRGPLSSASVDLFQREWTAAVPEPIGGLALWTCEADANKTNFCDPRFDELVERARREPSAVTRAGLYARAEEVLVGEDGLLPFVPIYWETYPNLEALRIKDSFSVNPLGQIELAAIDLR
jgi:oligopeptide transport system substrate-binding protein